MRPLLCAALAIALAACGGSPASPAPPASFSLADGAYTLLIASPPGAACFSMSAGSTAPDSAVSVDVTLSREGSEWVIRMADEAAGTLVVRLSPSGAGAAGRATGTAVSLLRSLGTTLDHPVSGTQAGTGASGTVIGETVTYASATSGGATVCGANIWTLVRR